MILFFLIFEVVSEEEKSQGVKNRSESRKATVYFLGECLMDCAMKTLHYGRIFLAYYRLRSPKRNSLLCVTRCFEVRCIYLIVLISSP